MYYFLKYFVRLYYILKKRKFVFLLFLLFLFIFLFKNSVHAVTYTNPTETNTTSYATIDTEQGFLEHYDNITNTFMAHAYYRWRNFNDPIFIQILASLENSEGGQAKYLYFYATADYIDCVVYYPVAASSADVTNWYGGRYSYISPGYLLRSDVSHLSVYRFMLGTGLIYNIPVSDVTENLYVPFPIWCQYSPIFTYWRERYSDFQDNSQFQNDLYNKLDDILVALGQQNVNAILTNIETNTKATSEELKNIENFMKDTNIDNNLSSSLPSDNTQDITNEGVNNIFSFLQNSFTSGTPKDIVIPIPFTNRSFTIQANFLQNILAKSDFEWLSNIIELFWWYIISVFIVKDISQKFTKIKSGDIENIQDNNIKEDML